MTPTASQIRESFKSEIGNDMTDKQLVIAMYFASPDFRRAMEDTTAAVNGVRKTKDATKRQHIYEAGGFDSRI